MPRVPRKLNELSRRLSVVAFGLWLGGVGCAFCCTAAPTAGVQTEAPAYALGTRSADAAAAATHCSARARPGPTNGSGRDRTAASAATSGPSSDHTASCCGKPRQPSSPARDQRPATENPTAGTRVDFSHRAAATIGAARPAPRGRSPDESATHVRCCLFLI